ncbi:MAG: NAD(P)/FAD-dependent oxidoreductase [Halodesulfurarchaeum sp.]
MTDRVVVLGAGYAGVGVLKQLETVLDEREADLHWISDHEHHFVLHEAHRIIRRPHLSEVLTIPIAKIKSSRTTFQEREVEDVDDERRRIRFADGSTISYDYVVDCLGSQTNFYGIDGLEAHALTLKSVSDALEVNGAVSNAARKASADDPAQVIVGGAGLSGIQSAGELARLRDERQLPIEIHLVEAMDQILPGQSHAFQGLLEGHLQDAEVQIHAGSPITTVDASRISFADRAPKAYDVFLWTGGITGIREIDDPHISVTDERIEVDPTLQSDGERLFALGDAAIVEQENGERPPPTAQAAWDAAGIAGKNVARTIRGEPLEPWHYHGNGTIVSVGDDDVAHDVPFTPVTTFDGFPATFLKKAIAARGIGYASSWKRAFRAWPNL